MTPISYEKSYNNLQDRLSNKLLNQIDQLLLYQNIHNNAVKDAPRLIFRSFILNTHSRDICIKLLSDVKQYYEQKGWLVSVKRPAKGSVISLVRLYKDTPLNRLKVKFLDIFDSVFLTEPKRL